MNPVNGAIVPQYNVGIVHQNNPGAVVQQLNPGEQNTTFRDSVTNEIMKVIQQIVGSHQRISEAIEVRTVVDRLNGLLVDYYQRQDVTYEQMEQYRVLIERSITQVTTQKYNWIVDMIKVVNLANEGAINSIERTLPYLDLLNHPQLCKGFKLLHVFSAFSDLNNWKDNAYYESIQTQVIKRGNHQELLLLGRNAGGIVVNCYDPQSGICENLINGPDWTDATGWNNECYHKTIQSQVIQRGGQQVVLLLARTSNGIILRCYDPLAKLWEGQGQVSGPAWSDEGGWKNDLYYKSIQSQVIQGVNRQELLLLARTSQGIIVHCYDPVDNVWGEQVNGPAWKDEHGWNSERHWKSIQTQVIQVGGQQVLLLLARASRGILLHSYDPKLKVWETLVDGPTWSCEQGWSSARYYMTIQTQVIQRGNQQVLLLIARNSNGIQLHCYDPQSRAWEQLADFDGWSDASCYETIRMQVIQHGNKQILLLTARDAKGVILHCYDPQINVWKELTDDSFCSNSNGGSDESCYKTFQTQVIQRGDRQELLLLARQPTGINLQSFDPHSKLNN